MWIESGRSASVSGIARAMAARVLKAKGCPGLTSVVFGRPFMVRKEEVFLRTLLI